jgi:hypothetical protein
MTSTRIFAENELRYAATSRCPCGAGLAYPAHTTDLHGAWDCSAILTGRAIPSGQEGAVQHTDRLPFAFYKVKSEDQPSANGATTRPRSLTDAEALERSATEAIHRCKSLDSQITHARLEVRRLEAEYDAEDKKRNELMERAFGRGRAFDTMTAPPPTMP